MLSINPDLTANDIRNILQETATKIDPNNALYDLHNGTVGRRVISYKWTEGWTTANFYTIGSKTYLCMHAFKKELIDEIRKFLEKIEPKTKSQLKKSIGELKKDLSFFEDKTITKAFKSLDKFQSRKE